jgi:hypothetical protein
MNALMWKKGDRLQLRACFYGGNGLSYRDGVTVASSDGFSGGWDVWDGERSDDVEQSFYGLSVEKVLP